MTSTVPTLPAGLSEADLHAGIAGEPSWRSALRAAGFTYFQAHGLPTRRMEAWKYTDISALLKRDWTPVAAPTTALTSLKGLVPDSAQECLVLCGGAPVYGLTRSLRQGGVVISPTPFENDAWAFDNAVELDGIAALTATVATRGFHIRIAANTELAEPIWVVHAPCTTAGWLPSLNTVHVGRHAKAMVIEVFLGDSADQSVQTPLSLVRVEDGAQLEHVRLQVVGNSAGWLGFSAVNVARDATFRSFVFQGGGTIGRDTLHTKVGGTGAHVDMTALYMPKNGQLLDHHTTLDHAVPDCTSNQYYKGVIGENGAGVFNGRIVVRQAAQRTAAEQLNKNLLLTRTSQVDAKPQLEIFADDVKCTHGATVGQLDAEELFYLQSRAIPTEVARRMLTVGFATDILERLGSEQVQAYVTDLVESRFAADTAAGE